MAVGESCQLRAQHSIIDQIGQKFGIRGLELQKTLTYISVRNCIILYDFYQRYNQDYLRYTTAAAPFWNSRIETLIKLHRIFIGICINTSIKDYQRYTTAANTALRALPCICSIINLIIRYTLSLYFTSFIKRLSGLYNRSRYCLYTLHCRTLSCICSIISLIILFIF